MTRLCIVTEMSGCGCVVLTKAMCLVSTPFQAPSTSVTLCLDPLNPAQALASRTTMCKHFAPIRARVTLCVAQTTVLVNVVGLLLGRLPCQLNLCC